MERSVFFNYFRNLCHKTLPTYDLYIKGSAIGNIQEIV